MPRMNMAKTLGLIALPALISAVVPASAQVVERTITRTVNQPVEQTITRTITKPGVQTTTYLMPIPNFSKRIYDLTSWIDSGLGKGWLTVDQADTFKNRVGMLSDMQARIRTADGNLDAARVDSLEKELTLLSADLSNAMQGRAIAGSYFMH